MHASWIFRLRFAADTSLIISTWSLGVRCRAGAEAWHHRRTLLHTPPAIIPLSHGRRARQRGLLGR